MFSKRCRSLHGHVKTVYHGNGRLRKYFVLDVACCVEILQSWVSQGVANQCSVPSYPGLTVLGLVAGEICNRALAIAPPWFHRFIPYTLFIISVLLHIFRGFRRLPRGHLSRRSYCLTTESFGSLPVTACNLPAKSALHISGTSVHLGHVMVILCASH